MKPFKTIGLIGRQRSSETVATLIALRAFLKDKYQLIFETETAQLVNEQQYPKFSREQFGQNCDLAIVVGGDGSLLHAAATVVDTQTPVIGINRGRVGFLTDISPTELEIYLSEILNGNYISEKRFLLSAEIQHQNKQLRHEIALNDVVLLPGALAQMIEFEIFIDDQYVCNQRADGQIIATPTGSTAYALSGGGPILHPSLNAIVLVPMFPQTLTSRPIVIHAESKVRVNIVKENETSPQVSCDGQQRVSIAPGDSLVITKYAKELTLLHPKNYDYYETLRNKLYWQKKI